MKSTNAYPAKATARSLLLLIGLTSQTTGVASQICVGPVRPNDGDRGLALPAPGQKGFGKAIPRDYEVQIDEGRRVPVKQEEGVMLVVELPKAVHTFSAFLGKKRVVSFKFHIASEPQKTCVQFQPLYEAWHMRTATSFVACGC